MLSTFVELAKVRSIKKMLIVSSFVSTTVFTTASKKNCEYYFTIVLLQSKIVSTNCETIPIFTRVWVCKKFIFKYIFLCLLIRLTDKRLHTSAMRICNCQELGFQKIQDNKLQEHLNCFRCFAKQWQVFTHVFLYSIFNKLERSHAGIFCKFSTAHTLPYFTSL